MNPNEVVREVVERDRRLMVREGFFSSGERLRGASVPGRYDSPRMISGLAAGLACPDVHKHEDDQHREDNEFRYADLAEHDLGLAACVARTDEEHHDDDRHHDDDELRYAD